MGKIVGLSDRTQALVVFVMICLVTLGTVSLPSDTPQYVKYLIGLAAAIGMALKEWYGSKPQ